MGSRSSTRGARLHGLTAWRRKLRTSAHSEPIHRGTSPGQNPLECAGARSGQAGCGQVTKDWNGEPRDGRVDLALGVPELEGMAWHEVG